MENLDDFIAFLRVAEAGGFSAAERTTGIPKSRLSRRVAELEQKLGVRLAQRSSHAFHLTDVGEQVYRHARAIADEAEAVQVTVSETQVEPRGLIRVSSSLLTGERFLARWLSEFMVLHPKVRISLDLSNHFVDLLAERFDLAIRVSGTPLAAADVVARQISTGKMVLVASPEILARHGVPRSPIDLERFPLVAQGNAENVRPWMFRESDGRDLTYFPQPRFVSDNLIAVREAALAGVGVAQMPLEACDEALRHGSLSELLPQHAPAASTVYAIYPSRRGVTSAVRTLIAFLEDRFQSMG
ncbi:MAG: LysR family transcriptional regulator [Hydrogenophaga sp.]|uniref:LysR substrate-binding domain-containing protein n=1 Tax=Hydrogenophaga sp. TaxID=1904254 RepID=UPI002635C6EF|nr:LysR substrate-binding domain-containing protein [Hydrogenophaga sp.]MCV0437003.1 LysR family transcriptional regulator [Hydrogenophaga sp.]